jgi:hypothetical protein
LKEFLEVSGRNPKIRMKTGTMFAIVEKYELNILRIIAYICVINETTV